MGSISVFRGAIWAIALAAAIPVAIVLHAVVGTLYAVFTIGLVAVFAALVQTIFDTLGLLRTAKRSRRRAPPALAERRTSTERSDRSRIAA